MVHLVRLGEDAGRLEALLNRAGVQCEESLDQPQSQFLRMIEPAVLPVIGCMVDDIILAMGLPVFPIGDLSMLQPQIRVAPDIRLSCYSQVF